MHTPNKFKRFSGIFLVLILLVAFSGFTPAAQPEMGSFIVKGSDIETVAALIIGCDQQPGR